MAKIGNGIAEIKEVEVEAPPEKTNESRKIKKHYIIAAVFLVAILGSYGYKLYREKNPVLAVDDIKSKTEKFINENLMQGGSKAEIKEIIEEKGMYRALLKVGNQEITTYISLDGRNFFPQVINMDEAQGAKSGAAKEVAEVNNKKDVPEVDLYVMSYCPYGVQMEKGILPVVQTLGSKIKFNLKFVDYTLHGKKEADENLQQYCIGQQDPAKLNNYLSCFVKSGDAAACLKTTGVNPAKLQSCIEATDKQFKISESFNASAQTSPFNIHKEDNDKYGVQGSPTLVINGETISSGRDSAGILKAVCSAFSSQPEECKKELSSVSPSPGFGEGSGVAGNNNAASCGN